MARMWTTPSTSICKDLPSRRCASAPARADAPMLRLSRASADATHAAVAGTLNLVAAVYGDDAACQIVIARLAEPGLPQHAEECLLIGMHADRFREVAIARLVMRHQPAEERQHPEGIGVV